MSPDQPPTDPRRRLWLALGVVAVLAAGGALAAFLVTRGDGQNASNATGATTAVSSAQGSGPAISVIEHTIAVPPVIGVQQATAKARIEDAGLTALARVARSPRAAGVVLQQNPAAGSRLPKGALVGLVVSAGPAAGRVPAVVGLSVAAAVSKVRAAGLTTLARSVASNRHAGLVVAQSPAPGARPARGAVVLSVSEGPPRTKVPDVGGLRRNAAVSLLRKAGFPVAIQLGHSRKARGTVIAQVPLAGDNVPAGSTVHITIAAANQGGQVPGEVTVPDVRNRQQADAERILRAAGLTPRPVRVRSLLAVGSVVDQAPIAGAPTAPGADVTISISTGPGP